LGILGESWEKRKNLDKHLLAEIFPRFYCKGNLLPTILQTHSLNLDIAIKKPVSTRTQENIENDLNSNLPNIETGFARIIAYIII
jgi:hypothetical protein